MRRVVLRLLFSLFFVLQLSCSSEPSYVTVISREKAWETVPLIDLNSGPTWAKELDKGNWVYWGQINEDADRKYEIKQPQIKYHHSYYSNRWMVVEGRLNSGKKYPVVLDTGASQTMFVDEKHIFENKLPIYSFEEEVNNGSNWGMCDIGNLTIGSVTFSNWPCFYRKKYGNPDLFPSPSGNTDPIIIGLPVLREFKYIKFDSLKKAAEMSSDRLFEANEPNSWSKYPLTIEENFSGNIFLFVKIPVAGKTTELQLDTGSGRGLAVSEELWEQMSEQIGYIKLEKAKDLYPFIGELPCRRGVIENLTIGDRVVNNAGISVFPDDSPLLEGCDGLLGMQYFQDTVIVLDFDQNLLWVKKPKR